MKKIERVKAYDPGHGVYYDLQQYCTVLRKDLDEQEKYIEKLEREKEEAIQVLIDCQNELRSLGHESIALGMESTSPLLQRVRIMIKQFTGKTWQELKEERG
jgi:hypothetical protein